MQIYRFPCVPSDEGTKERQVRLFNDAGSSGAGDDIKRKAESKIQLFFHYLLYVYCITRVSMA